MYLISFYFVPLFGLVEIQRRRIDAISQTGRLRAILENMAEMGTARMGRNPKTSVLNAYNQAHDVPNLFVTDGACMTSSACQNPSLTYMALTTRAVDYAVGELQRRNL